MEPAIREPREFQPLSGKSPQHSYFQYDAGMMVETGFCSAQFPRIGLAEQINLM